MALYGDWFIYLLSFFPKMRVANAQCSFFFNKFIYLCLVALGLCFCTWAFLAAVSQGYCSLWCTGFSLQRLLFVAEHRLEAHRFQ